MLVHNDQKITNGLSETDEKSFFLKLLLKVFRKCDTIALIKWHNQ